MDEKDEVQPDPTDIQPDDQDNNENENDNDDGFEPRLSAKEYADKWRQASAEAAKYRKELAKIKADEDKRAKEQLKEQGKYKEMYESTNAELQKIKDFWKSASRSTAFRKKAIELGCKPEVVEVLERAANLESIELDENYAPNMDQVTFEVEKLREKYGPHFFQKKANPPKDGPPKAPETKGLTYEQWLQLPLEEKKKRMSEVAGQG